MIMVMVMVMVLTLTHHSGKGIDYHIMVKVKVLVLVKGTHSPFRERDRLSCHDQGQSTSTGQRNSLTIPGKVAGALRQE